MLKAEEPSGGYLFEETQAFPKWLSIVMLSPIALTIGITLLIGTVEKQQEKEMWIVLAFIIPLQLLMFYLFYIARLEKIVTTNGLYFRWTPLQKKYRLIEMEDIERFGIRKAPFAAYGSKWEFGYGRVHNLGKDHGIQVYLKSGKKIFFGTADKTGLEKAIQQLMENRKTN